MNIQKILVGTDFSAQAEVAVHQALNIARAQGAELVLAYAGNIPQPPGREAPPLTGPAQHFQQILREQFAAIRGRLEELRERLDGQGATVSHVVVDSLPDEGLVNAAKDVGADLVVVGTHGRTGFKRFLLGSVAEHVVRMAHCAVIVARDPVTGTAGSPKAVPGAGGYGRILVPVDFSPYSEAALDAAITLARPEAIIDLFHVWQLPGASWAAQDVWSAEGGALREELAAESCAQGEQLMESAIKRKGVRLTFSHKEGKPGHAIQDNLEANGHDLVVMGSHGRRGFRRLMLGSIAEATVRYSRCSVAVVHLETPADEAERLR